MPSERASRPTASVHQTASQTQRRAATYDDRRAKLDYLSDMVGELRSLAAKMDSAMICYLFELVLLEIEEMRKLRAFEDELKG